MENFLELGLPKSLTDALNTMGITAPTPIQAKAIPLALEGKDILGSAATGTGKTAAFAIPIISRLARDPQATALVLTPTRELATQIREAIRNMTIKSQEIKSVLLIGGDSMYKQLSQLKSRPRIIIGTPGRVNDHLEQKSLNLSQTRILVLDETDRMLDMGFSVQIERIVKYIPAERQTLLFSATMPTNIARLAAQYLKNPVRVEVDAANKPHERINHTMINVNDTTKFSTLVSELNRREGSVVVFAKTKFGTEKLAKRLRDEKLMATAIHGDLRQRQRDKVIQDFRDSRFRVLIATDVACRGLDIPHLRHVVNYDLPQKPEDFIHRIGRTGRNGAEGEAISLIMPSDRGLWRDISRLLNPGEKPAEFEQREQRPFRKSSAGSRKPFNSNFKNRGNFKEGRGEPREERKEGRSEFRPDRNKFRGERSEQPREDRGGFKPRGDFRETRNEQPREERSERPRGNFRPDRNRFKTEGAEQPREARSGGFKPRGDFRENRSEQPKEGGFREARGERPRGNFRPDRNRFKTEGGENRSEQPREARSGGFKPRGDFRENRNEKPREGGFREARSDKPREDRGGFKGGFKPGFKGRKFGGPKRVAS